MFNVVNGELEMQMAFEEGTGRGARGWKGLMANGV
jgi:hypothetical protein